MCWLPGFASTVQVIYESRHHTVPHKYIWLLLVSQKCLYRLLKQKYLIFMLNFYICNYFHSSISSHTFQKWIRKSDVKNTQTDSIFFFIYLTFISPQPQKFRLRFTYFTHEVIIHGNANIMSFYTRGLTVLGFCYSSWKPLRKISWEYWEKNLHITW